MKEIAQHITTRYELPNPKNHDLIFVPECSNAAEQPEEGTAAEKVMRFLCTNAQTDGGERECRTVSGYKG